MSEHPCIDCGDLTLNPERCRDCDIEYSLNCMQCSVCERMRWRNDRPGSESAVLAQYLWGEPCQCPVGTPSVHEARSMQK